ncbi:MAG TPA: FtsW/RodA/SpoVE family cell cycle protein, partial [Thermoanaerobaculia bacterium]|nr:FtsW/RodA/SpoVE family cell cycle protein [Thermoanaerobaculia bacterium]
MPRRLDLVVLGSVLSLAILGVLFVGSATAAGGASRLHGLATRQAIWVSIGIALMCGAVVIDYRTLLKISFPLYLASLVPLIYLLAFGQR